MVRSTLRYNERKILLSMRGKKVRYISSDWYYPNNAMCSNIQLVFSDDQRIVIREDCFGDDRFPEEEFPRFSIAMSHVNTEHDASFEINSSVDSIHIVTDSICWRFKDSPEVSLQADIAVVIGFADGQQFAAQLLDHPIDLMKIYPLVKTSALIEDISTLWKMKLEYLISGRRDIHKLN